MRFLAMLQLRSRIRTVLCDSVAGSMGVTGSLLVPTCSMSRQLRSLLMTLSMSKAHSSDSRSSIHCCQTIQRPVTAILGADLQHEPPVAGEGRDLEVLQLEIVRARQQTDDARVAEVAVLACHVAQRHSVSRADGVQERMRAVGRIMRVASVCIIAACESHRRCRRPVPRRCRAVRHRRMRG